MLNVQNTIQRGQHPDLALNAFGDFEAPEKRKAQPGAEAAAAPIPPLSAALGLSCRRLATAGNETLAILRGHLRTCKIIRCKGYNDEAFIVLIAAAALAIYRSRGETPRTPLYAALGFTFGGLAAAGNERDHGSSVEFLASVHECSGSWD
jgi:hypothetical protein